MRSSIEIVPARRRATSAGLLGVVAAVASASCTTALPMREVVIYRNGVAYFERGGHVTQSQVRFKMKRSGVGDFLSTLAVSERSGAGSAANATGAPVHAVDVDAEGDESSTPLETVVLTLDGHPHDLRVGYIGESPIWKPSYRLILHGGGAAHLQVWGVVQNLSGEDWKTVQLSLVAGAPIAFQSDLQTPVMPSLPMVTDRGDPTPPMVPGAATYGYRAEMRQAMNGAQVAAASTSTSSSTTADARLAARRRELMKMYAAGTVPRDTSAALAVTLQGGPRATTFRRR